MKQFAISERMLAILEALEPDVPVEAKVVRLAQQELRRRLARYQLTDQIFRQKYAMSLEEFERNEMVKRLNYSFEVESDHQDWDLALDGLRSIERQLNELGNVA